MEVTLLLMEQIIILFLLMGCGFLLVKSKLLRKEDSQTLSIMCIYLISPFVIIKSFQVEYTPKILQGFFLALASAVLFHVLMLVLSKVGEKLFGLNNVEKVSLVYTNAGNLVIPLVSAILGDEYVIYTSAFTMVQLMFFWTHGQSTILGQKKFSIMKALKNLNIISIFVGVILFAFQIKLPKLVLGAMGNLTPLMGPIGMILLGMIFAGSKLGPMFKGKRIYLFVFLKMIVCPAIFILIVRFTGMANLVEDGKTILFVGQLAAMAPTATLVTQVSQLYNKSPDYAAAINMATTLSSLVTMPLMCMLYYL